MLRLIEILFLVFVLVACFRVNSCTTNGSSSSCPSVLNINWSDLPPFLYLNHTTNKLSGDLIDITSYMENTTIYQCGCHDLQFHFHHMNISFSHEIETKIRRSRSKIPELYFPVFANRRESTQYQRPFLELFQSPGPAIIHLSIGTWREKLSGIAIVFDTWPILSVCLVLCILAGFVVWAIECRSNPDDFPAKFPHGVLIGIWWSFVTMTTVGYGDKTTRTFVGRLFAVFWMVTGTIVLSMFTGQITANITSSEMERVNVMGKKIGVPRGMKSFIRQEINLGGHYREISYLQINAEVERPSGNLQYFIAHDNELAKAWVSKFGGDNVRIVKNIDRQFTIGMIVTGLYDEKTRIFFRCLQREITDLYQLNRDEEIEELNSESDSNKDKQPTSQIILLISCWVAIVLLFLLGFLWKCMRRERSSRTVDADVEG